MAFQLAITLILMTPVLSSFIPTFQIYRPFISPFLFSFTLIDFTPFLLPFFIFVGSPFVSLAFFYNTIVSFPFKPLFSPFVIRKEILPFLKSPLLIVFRVPLFFPGTLKVMTTILNFLIVLIKVENLLFFPFVSHSIVILAFLNFNLFIWCYIFNHTLTVFIF